MASSKYKLPKDWPDVKPMGKPIPESNFVAFKLPLKAERNQLLPKAKQFYVKNVLDAYPKLGLVIDLTTTAYDEFYDPKEFTSKGVEHVKLYGNGHEVPRAAVVDSFFEVVDTFLEKAPKKQLIGVHCGHGINRSGYMICR